MVPGKIFGNIVQIPPSPIKKSANPLKSVTRKDEKKDDKDDDVVLPKRKRSASERRRSLAEIIREKVLSNLG